MRSTPRWASAGPPRPLGPRAAALAAARVLGAYDARTLRGGRPAGRRPASAPRRRRFAPGVVSPADRSQWTAGHHAVHRRRRLRHRQRGRGDPFGPMIARTEVLRNSGRPRRMTSPVRLATTPRWARPHGQSAWERLDRWSRDGTWERLVQRVQGDADAAVELDWVLRRGAPLAGAPHAQAPRAMTAATSSNAARPAQAVARHRHRRRSCRTSGRRCGRWTPATDGTA